MTYYFKQKALQKEREMKDKLKVSVCLALLITGTILAVSVRPEAKADVQNEQIEPLILDGESYTHEQLYPKIITANITAYNTVAEQTDNTPCIAAGGYICGRTDVVACPRSIPLHTKVKIGDNIYECMDRLAMKYDNRFDISFDKDLEGAHEWGIKKMQVIIY